MHYYQHHIGDYLSHTANLSLLEHGVYLRLLHCYYMAEGPLAGDVYRMIGARSQEEKQAVDYVLETFFTSDIDGFRQSGADKRIEEFKKKSEKARKAVEVRWNNERNTDVSDLHTDVSETDTDAILTNNHKPITNNHNHKPKREKPLPAVAGRSPAGSRIPDDWIPDVVFAASNGMSELDALTESERFRDYWRAQPGGKGRKTDWQATWRNWVRRAVESKSPTRPRPTPPDSFTARHTDTSWRAGL